MADIDNIRTLEDLTNVVAQLYFNLNTLDSKYYDMFINPEPMVIELERYDEAGQLTKVYLNNRAKDRDDSQGVLTGVGNPNGQQVAGIGTFYIDTATATLYYKGAGVDAYGWISVSSSQNFIPGVDYLAPNGNGSQLKFLNADSISSGTLSVLRGGTGVDTITGLIKGNGASSFTTAVEGTDYIAPSGLVGIICYYPNNIIPSGWLRCDGAAYSRTTYSRLYSKIGVTYGEGNGSTTFNVPNLMNLFIRGWDGVRSFNSVQDDQVGSHTHTFSGNTGSGTPHSHTRGDMNITGNIYTSTVNSTGGADGAFSYEAWHSGTAESWGGSGNHFNLDASRSWTGSTSAENTHTHAFSGITGENASNQETRVKNVALVPIIKY